MELLELGRIFFALMAVIGLIGAAALIAQRLGLAQTGALAANRKRLALLEVLPLDQKRKAAIIKCDGREHLVVLNVNSVTVIERGINQKNEPHAQQNEPAAAAEPIPPVGSPASSQDDNPVSETTPAQGIETTDEPDALIPLLVKKLRAAAKAMGGKPIDHALSDGDSSVSETKDRVA